MIKAMKLAEMTLDLQRPETSWHEPIAGSAQLISTLHKKQSSIKLTEQAGQLCPYRIRPECPIRTRVSQLIAQQSKWDQSEFVTLTQSNWSTTRQNHLCLR